ncbi:hypothetical protein [Terrabacter sp. NPDC000476]|uniref:hypothetical protein n=1 Tax=Terrabacter sp. NPDC000476 TaxID=3154258 RepID=UPI00332C4920
MAFASSSTPVRGRHRRRRLPVAALAVTTVALAACSAEQQPTAAPTASARCAVSAQLVPACGVLLGVTPPDPTASSLAAADAAAARPYDFVYRFHDLDAAIPDEVDRSVVDAGRLLHVAIGTRQHQKNGRTYTWREVADGVVDAQLTAQAKGIAGLKVPVWVTFDHEPDNGTKQPRGSGADYVEAWRHVHEVFAAAGTTNAVWVWVVTGASESLDRVEQFWPGNDVVDWVSWESYNPAGCRAGRLDPSRWKSFEAALLVFHDWLTKNGARVGIDLSKPQMISESGSVKDPSNPDRRAAWYRDIESALSRYPQIKAVGLWDHTGNNICDYRFSEEAPVQAGVDTLLTSPRLSQTQVP